jgi:hypothetical protein
MARRNVLAHTSASGGTLTDRLANADVLFAANGENIARSETFVPELIHQSFMGSQGHRENILNPDFDEAGIGVVREKGGTYFVTEDFIRGLVRRDDNEAQAIILGILNDSRKAKGLPLLVPLELITTTAKAFARNRAAGRELPQVPSFFGETSVHFAIGAELTQLAEAIAAKAGTRSDRIGIGVWFTRDREYPGGAYWVCVLLVGGDRPPGKSDLERTLSAWNAVNGIRNEMNLRRLEFDQGLFAKADEILSLHRQGKRPPASFGAPAVWYFYLARPGDLGGIPDEARLLIGNRMFGRIGISIQPMLTQDGLEVMQAVALVLDR